MSDSGYPYPPNSDKTAKDGSRSAQGAITTDYHAIGIPSRPMGKIVSANGRTTGHYPPGPAGGESTIFRFDLALVDLNMVYETTSDGPTKTAVFASFGNRPRPDPRDPDSYCNGFVVLGFHKNNLTEPATGNYQANMGSFRAMSKMSSVQTAGAGNVPYDNPKRICAGDPAIWMPPEDNGGTANSGMYGPKNEQRALPYLAPLHWSLIASAVNNVNLAMLHLHAKGLALPSPAMGPDSYGQTSSKGTWNEAAREKARLYAVVAASFLVVWIQKGYVKVLTPSVSMLEALKDKFESEVSAAIDNNDLVLAQTLLDQYKKNKAKYSAGHNSKSFDDENRHQLFYFDPNKRDIGYGGTLGVYAVNRETEHYVQIGLKLSGNDTSSTSLNKEKLRGNSMEWMLQNLGLGGVHSGHVDPSTRKTTYDALRLACSGSLGPDFKLDAQQYLRITQDFVNAQWSSVMEAFKGHLEACHVGESVESQRLRDSLTRRIVGRALTSSTGGGELTAPNMGPTVDIDFGAHAV
jgi:hypothetical protein